MIVCCIVLEKTKLKKRDLVREKKKCVTHFVVPEDYEVQHQVRTSVFFFFGTWSAIKFPLAIYRVQQIEPHKAYHR